MSNCDSEGCPIDHDGNQLEDGVLNSSAPFAVRADVFAELFSGSGKDCSLGHLETNPAVGAKNYVPSSSGGIPINDQVTVEDYISSDDEPLSPKSAMELCNNNTSATVHAMMRASKHERDALVSARNKLFSVLRFLKSKGFSEESIFSEMDQEGFGYRVPVRDDFGLPVGQVKQAAMECHGSVLEPNPFVDKLKKKIDCPNADVVLDDMRTHQPSVKLPDKGPSSTTDQVCVNMPENPVKSWSQVVSNAAPVSPKISLSYVPPPAGETLVSPPDDVLKAGVDKLKTSIVGTFTKGTVPYSKVLDFANSLWKNRGLLDVGQKDNRTFFFRFNSESDMVKALAKGTWYIDRKPMVVHAWGTSVNSVTTMPLWVRFDRIPDSYWTQDCLSRIASVIGPPICADELTSKLNILPFAKICVNYSIGNTLPTVIPVTVLDPISNEKVVEEVLVSYPNKPLACTSCKSLGHLVGSCPVTVRKWIRKVKEPIPEPSSVKVDKPTAQVHVPKDDKSEGANASNPTVDGECSPKTPVSTLQTPLGVDSAVPDSTATPVHNFKNLKRVDEIDAKHGADLQTDSGEFKLTRGQRKKLKKAKGKSPSTS